MARELSSRMRRAVLSQQTGEVVTILVTIDHAQLSEPIRVTSDAVATEREGDDGTETYIAFPFRFRFADDRAAQLTTAELEIDNVDRRIVETLRRVRGAPTVAVKMVLASDPDTIEGGEYVFTLQQAKYNASTVTGTLGDEDLLNEPFPGIIVTPGNVPGNF